MKFTNRNVPWDGGDLLKVFLLIFVGIAGFYVALLLIFGNYKWTFLAARYFGALLTGLLPYVWIRRKYRSHANLLGFQRGNYKFLYSFLIALAGAVTSAMIIYSLSSGKHMPISIDSKLKLLELNIYTYPVSIDGMITVFIGPFTEEILMRGFMYSYFRRRLGVVFGLLLQSLIFALSHLGFAYDNSTYVLVSMCFIGLMLGIIYELTDSIYPSVVCHGAYNLTTVILGVYLAS